MSKSLNVVLHAHSVWSYDGRWTLRQIARFFGALGVDVVMMSEHDSGFRKESFAEYRAACANASDEKCTLIPGIEYSSPDNDIHILTWGLDHFLAEHRPVLETLKKVTEEGGVSVFAHPIRRQAYLKFEDTFVPYLSGIEVWNRKSDGIAPGKEAAKLIDATGLAPTVGVDFHNIRHYWPLTHRLSVDCNDLEKGLVRAIRGGRLEPQLASRRIFNAKGELITPVSDTLEVARKKLKQISMSYGKFYRGGKSNG